MNCINTVLNIASILLSISAIAIANARIGKVEYDPNGFYGWVCACLGLIITILMAWQIFNIISIDKKIEKNAKKIQSRAKKGIMKDYYENQYNTLKVLWTDFRDTKKWNLLIDTHIYMINISIKCKKRDTSNDIICKCKDLLGFSAQMEQYQVDRLKEVRELIKEIPSSDEIFDLYNDFVKKSSISLNKIDINPVKIDTQQTNSQNHNYETKSGKTVSTKKHQQTKRIGRIMSDYNPDSLHTKS